MLVSRDFRVYGHRGAPKEYPENTLHGFAAALASGCNALEIDVHLTLDGYVVVAHDESGQRMAYVKRLIQESAWHEVSRWNVARGFSPDTEANARARAPLLDEVLDTFGNVPISVDLKTEGPALAKAVLRVLARAKAPERTRALVSLTSFHQRTFGYLRDGNYNGRLGMGPADVLRLWALPTVLLSDLRGRAVQVPVSHGGLEFASERFIRKAHSLDCRVDYWTINDAAEARALIDKGADGIVTDDVRPLKLRAPAPAAS